MKNIESGVELLYSGKEYIRAAIVFILALAALINDIKHFKIPNKLNLTFIIIGFFFNIWTGSVGNSFLGMLAPMILFPFFMARLMGAGDIKLFCAIGSITGVPYIFSIICYSVLFNGVIALILLIVRKEKGGFKRLLLWIGNSVRARKILPYQKLDPGSKNIFRYAIGIALGCFYYIITDVFMGGAYALL